MTNFQRYLSIIASLSNKLRTQLAQYGLNNIEVANYINTLIKNSFRPDQQQQTITTQKLVTNILKQNHKQIEKTLLKIIQVFDEQLYNLSIQQDEYCQEIAKTNEIKQKHTNPIKLNYFPLNLQNQKVNPFQISTPKSKSKYEEMLLKKFYDRSDITNDLNSIQKGIQQTLQRTRKLRMLLDYKSKETIEKKSRFSSPEAQEIDQIFND